MKNFVTAIASALLIAVIVTSLYTLVFASSEPSPLSLFVLSFLGMAGVALFNIRQSALRSGLAAGAPAATNSAANGRNPGTIAVAMNVPARPIRKTRPRHKTHPKPLPTRHLYHPPSFLMGRAKPAPLSGSIAARALALLSATMAKRFLYITGRFVTLTTPVAQTCVMAKP